MSVVYCDEIVSIRTAIGIRFWLPLTWFQDSKNNVWVQKYNILCPKGVISISHFIFKACIFKMAKDVHINILEYNNDLF